MHVEFANPDKKMLSKEIVTYQEKGYQVTSYENYNIVEESPDICVFVKPYDMVPKGFTVEDIYNAVPRLVYIPYGMETGNEEESLYYQYRLPLHVVSWKVISYSEFHSARAKKYGYRDGENIVTISHPRLDCTFGEIRKEKFAKNLEEKANGRKIVLWNTHFTIREDGKWGSFIQWYKIIIKCVQIMLVSK